MKLGSNSENDIGYIRWTRSTKLIAVAYKVNSEKTVHFRKWSTEIVKEFSIKAYVIDDEQLKNKGTILLILKGANNVFTNLAWHDAA